MAAATQSPMTVKSNGRDELDVYDFTESTGSTVEDLEAAYDTLEDSYWLDEKNEKVIVQESTWTQVNEILDSQEGSDNSQNEGGWKSKAKNYLFENDREFIGGGLLGVGSGLISSGLGYTAAADFLVTGGAFSISWGLGGIIGDYIVDRWDLDDEKPAQEPDKTTSELDSYSSYDVEVVDLESYGQALSKPQDST